MTEDMPHEETKETSLEDEQRTFLEESKSSFEELGLNALLLGVPYQDLARTLKAAMIDVAKERIARLNREENTVSLISALTGIPRAGVKIEESRNKRNTVIGLVIAQWRSDPRYKNKSLPRRTATDDASLTGLINTALLKIKPKSEFRAKAVIDAMTAARIIVEDPKDRFTLMPPQPSTDVMMHKIIQGSADKTRVRASSIRTNNPENIVILTGAGISADSGIPTFRDKGGLWEQHDYKTLASLEGFKKNPAEVLQFHNDLRRNLPNYQPNAAHLALARLQKQHAGKVTIITQNVDDLHERGTDTEVIHMHGSLKRGKCASCDFRWEQQGEQTLDQQCSRCSAKSCRPDIVWFGERPYFLDHIRDLVSKCDLFAAIGTSGVVSPANELVGLAMRNGAHSLEINIKPTKKEENLFVQQIEGKASEVVPQWVESIL